MVKYRHTPREGHTLLSHSVTPSDTHNKTLKAYRLHNEQCLERGGFTQTQEGQGGKECDDSNDSDARMASDSTQVWVGRYLRDRSTDIVQLRSITRADN